MSRPVFPDGTTPLHSSIGLSPLVAEVYKPPFGGAFFTFSIIPTVKKLDLSETLSEKNQPLPLVPKHDELGLRVAVFEKLILPMAVENQLRQEDMPVKRVIVFTDMQFDCACDCDPQACHS